MGATALVVADNLCVCGSACSPQAGCQYTEPVLADDGSGADIVIPAVMLPKQEADDIVNYFRCGKLPIQGRPQTCAWSPDWSQEAMVQASLEYTVPNPDDRVEWELWTTSIDGASLDFLTAFKDTVLQLGTHQHFAPMMYTYNGSQYGCDVKQTGSDMCGNLCTNGGLYCAPDPDGSQDEGISGADVVAENLRRACLWDLVGGDDVADKNQVGVGKVWWDYVSEFTRLCSTAETFADDACWATAMANAGALAPSLVRRATHGVARVLCVGERTRGARGRWQSDSQKQFSQQSFHRRTGHTGPSTVQTADPYSPSHAQGAATQGP